MSGSIDTTVGSGTWGPAASGKSSAPVVAPGATVGRYEVVDKLGEGAMGVVYVARDPELRRTVALKVVHPRRADLEIDHLRLLREARAMARLSHPHVVPVLDVGEVDAIVFVAMELVEGRTLAAWQHAEPRPWQDVVKMYLGAARGLAAAHDAGIVHRDFKPENVLVGEDGRARVTDFGLARGRADDTESAEAAASTGTASSPDEVIGDRLTRTGMALGTPAYMAPEQHERAPVGPAADQFSFCVALFEALYGKRPFPGDTAVQLRAAIQKGEIVAVDRGRVPSRIEAALRRGLSARPEDRFADMGALMAALTQGSGARWWWALALVPALAIGGALASRDEPAIDPRCAAGPELDAVWNDARRQAVLGALGGTHGSFEDRVGSDIVARLDRYSGALSSAFTEACDPSLPSAALEQRLGCFTAGRNALAAWSASLSAPGATDAAKLVSGGVSLPSLDRCREHAETQPVPTDPATRDAIQHAFARLEQATALMHLGKEPEAAVIAEPLLAEAERLGFTPLTMRVRHVLGTLAQRAAKLDEAIPLLEASYYDALQLDEDDLATQVALLVASAYGMQAGKTEQALQWIDHARARAERASEPALAAQVARGLGDVKFQAGDIPAAVEAYREAVERWQSQEDERAYESGIAATSLASLLVMQGDLDDAEALLRPALAARVAKYGPDFPANAQIHNTLGYVHLRRQKWNEAEQAFARAVELYRVSLGDAHPNVAAGLNNLGEVAMARGEHDRAAERFAEALAIAEPKMGATHPRVAMVRSNLAEARREQGRLEDADELFGRVLTDLETALGTEHPELVLPLIGRGETVLALGRPADAVALLRRALAIELQPPDPHGAALAHFALARALHATGEPAEAHAEAIAAREAHTAAPESTDEEKAAVDAWLRDHPASAEK